MPLGDRQLAILSTFRCNAECAHCGSFSHPRQKTHLDVDRMLNLIREAAELGFTGLSLTGGEPTLEPDAVLVAMKLARQHDMPVRLVTNAHWTADDAATEAQIFEWVFAGMTELTVTTGDEHARFVPVAYALRAVRIAAILNVPVNLAIENHAHSPGAWAEVATDLSTLINIAPSNWFDPASRTSPDFDPRSSEPEGCDDVLSIYTVQADGTITPCCGVGVRAIPQLRMGQASLREAIERTESSPTLRAIRERKPMELWRELTGTTPKFVHRCQACIAFHRLSGELKQNGSW